MPEVPPESSSLNQGGRGLRRSEFLARTAAAAAGASTLGALVSACDSDSSESGGSPAAGRPPSEPTGTARIGTGGGILTLNPAKALDLTSISAGTSIYAALVEEGDGPGSYVPGLATEMADEGGATKWKVTLRKGATFHDGSPVTAAAIKENLDFYAKGEFPYTALLGAYKRATVVNDRTLRVTFTAPNPDFPLSTIILRILAPATIEGGEEAIERKPLGAGPFRLVERSESELVVEAFRDYWADGPYLSRLQFRDVPELSTRLNALQSGQLELIQKVPPLQVAQLKRDASVRLQTFDTYIVGNLFLKAEKAPLQRVEVRRAIWHAIDKSALAKSVLRGQATVQPSFVPEGIEDFKPGSDPYPFDTDRARALLREAGADGAAFTIPIPEGVGTLSTEIGEAIASQLRDAGLDAKAEVLPVSVTQADFGEREPRFPAALFESTWLNGSAFQITQQFFGSYAGQPELVKLEKQAAASVGDERSEAIRAVNEFNDKSVFSVPLYSLKQTDATSNRLVGYEAKGNGFVNLTNAYLAQ